MNKTADPRIARLGGGVGRIYLWEDASLWIGHGSGRVMPHAHHAVQLTLSLDETVFELHEAGSPPARSRFALVPAHLRHVFNGRGGQVGHVFVAPESREGRALMERFGKDAIARLPDADCAPAVAAMARSFFGARRDEQAVTSAARTLVRTLAGTDAPRPLDPRIAKVRAHVARHAAGKLALADAARAVHLSPERLRHLFMQEMGTTFRAYVVWQRLLHASATMMDGASWTEAAHAAGFADSAHLSRSFRRMFGVSPTMIVRDEMPAASVSRAIA
ncbi:MAG TPA: AraC family transcriptional regulator [Usitatibacter sp.]|nr:AraC family transcriptional regulator [Usitatibacter sp.]